MNKEIFDEFLPYLKNYKLKALKLSDFKAFNKN